jgi:hypothetical protein
MGNAWTDKNEIAIVIGLNIVTNIPMAATVARQSQFELGMVVPLEWDAFREPTVQNAQDASASGVTVSKKGFMSVRFEAFRERKEPEQYQCSPVSAREYW